MRFLTGAITFLAATVAISAGSAAAKPRQTAGEATTQLLDAFNALDPARFDPFFAPDATMFFPDGPFPQQRIEGREAVTAAFRQFFTALKQRGATQLRIQPLDLKVQDYGKFAIVTFHLKGNGNVGRRSLTMRREREGWRILHFHASALEEKK